MRSARLVVAPLSTDEVRQRYCSRQRCRGRYDHSQPQLGILSNRQTSRQQSISLRLPHALFFFFFFFLLLFFFIYLFVKYPRYNWYQPAAGAFISRLNSTHGSFFTTRCYASAVLAMALCPSVRPSQVGVLLKRLNVGSHKQHLTRDSSFLMPKISAKFYRDNPYVDAECRRGGSKSALELE